MFNFFKKPKLEFVCLLPEVKQIMPIVPAKEISFEWTKKALSDYKSKIKDNPYERFTHISRCPGILGITKKGWVQRSWQDVVIKTNGDGKSFEWKTPINQAITDADHNWKWDYVSHHPEELFSQYNKLNKNTLKTIIKIQSPWMVYIPKGYVLMSMPIPYPDNHVFTAATGFLDGDYGPNFLNVQMFWHELNGETFVPAGTPLCQYILIKKEKETYDVRDVNTKDITNLRLRASAIDSKYISNYTKLKDLEWKK